MTAFYETLTADQILNIKHPYELFGTTCYKQALRKLQMLWHPDRNSHEKANDVSIYINKMGIRAENGDWGNLVTIDESDNKQYIFKYKKKVEIDIGEMFIGRKMVLFRIDNENKDLYEAGIDSIQNVKYSSKMIAENFTRLVPKDIHQYSSSNGLYVTMYKGANQLCLADLVEAKFDFQPGHLSWIITGLYNFALFMEKAQHKMFGGLSLDSVFINPEFRSVHILGGWWFSQSLNKNMIALPNWIINHCSKSILSTKKATTVIDQVAIRCLALRLLGDTTMVGCSLLHNKKNAALIQFLRSSPSKSLLEDYRFWLKIENDLPKLDVLLTFNDLYTQ